MEKCQLDIFDREFPSAVLNFDKLLGELEILGILGNP